MWVDHLFQLMSQSIRHVRPVPLESATGLVARAYDQMRADFFPVPLLTLHSPSPRILAGVWSVLRESLLAGEGDRVHREIVAAAVSKVNECPFCTDAHALMLQIAAADTVADHIRAGAYDRIVDADQRALVDWVLAQRAGSNAAGRSAAFGADEAPALIGTAVAFHYINRMVNVFLGERLLPVPALARGATERFLVSAGKPFVRQLPAGASLTLLEASELPNDLNWAQQQPAVAGAFAGLAAAVEVEGSRVLSEPVRRAVRDRVRSWTGETMGLSRAWVERVIADLSAGDRPAARLALLVALASFQIDTDVIQAFRAQHPSDADLIAATAWASFAAARRAGTLLAHLITTKEATS